MPTISMFYGILIRMFFKDIDKHHSPHIHADFQGQVGTCAIPDGSLLAGELPRINTSWSWRGSRLKNPAVPRDGESSIPLERKHTYSRSHSPKQATRNALAVGFTNTLLIIFWTKKK